MLLMRGAKEIKIRNEKKKLNNINKNISPELFIDANKLIKVVNIIYSNITMFNPIHAI